MSAAWYARWAPYGAPSRVLPGSSQQANVAPWSAPFRRGATSKTGLTKRGWFQPRGTSLSIRSLLGALTANPSPDLPQRSRTTVSLHLHFRSAPGRNATQTASIAGPCQDHLEGMAGMAGWEYPAITRRIPAGYVPEKPMTVAPVGELSFSALCRPVATTGCNSRGPETGSGGPSGTTVPVASPRACLSGES